MKKILNFISSKPFIVGVLILLQLLTLFVIVFALSEYFFVISSLLTILSFLMTIYVINKQENPSYKLAWIIPILSIPMFGGLLYLLFGGQKVPKQLMRRDHASSENVAEIIKQDEEVLDEIKQQSMTAFKHTNYIWKYADFPVYKNTETQYFPIGEKMFEMMIDEIKKAKHYIFMEYFIIQEGKMWDTILDILVEKVNEGVDVRVLYDDAGCIRTLETDYDEKLRSLGIKCKVFNPIEPRLAMQMNNRDHRKILVIDGIVGMTGGINLADEYINEVERFGHWKDCGIMLRGEAVWNFTLMFLQFWNYDETYPSNYLDYQPDPDAFNKLIDDGYVQPFSDSPTDDEAIGKNTHMNIINGAKKYVYIQSPYLIIDYELKTALILAAKMGVDVRIMVPHIPDKPYVFELTQSNYQELIEGGVRIFEYTPGFIHSKTFVCDDNIALVGTINTDYRSYYLHYECGVWLYKSKAVMQLKEDYLETELKCQEITLDDCLNVSFTRRFIRAFLNLFAPMM